ncbi:MAG: helix-turn-helix transcriptional regulator [Proteobacteria bacterium]|nr:helix-turn-helix transcriptional regulator [Pseudomonadota bacterium]
MDPLQALSALISWGQTHSEIGASATFRRDALRELQTQVGFDQAIWAEALIADQLSLRSAELHNIDEAARADFERAAFADPRLPTVLGAPGRAHAYSVRPDDPVEYRERVARIDVGHFISICQFDPILGVASGVVLFAAPQRGPFSDGERSFVEAAFPHLMAGWSRCQVVALERSARAKQSLPRFSAACRGATIDAAEPEFLSLMRTEWPHWVGPRLPTPLIDPVTGAALGFYLGKQVVAHAKVAVDTALVVARKRSLVDDLTARERAVAELCAQGLTYRDIAAWLSLAPATARNHLAAVHRRLGVTRNSEVASLLAMAAAPWPADDPA